jgi:hypothetical protein
MTKDTPVADTPTLSLDVLYLHPDAGTPHQNAVEREKSQIQAQGAVGSITVFKSTDGVYYVIEPVARFVAARELGYETVPIQRFAGTWFDALNTLAGSNETRQSRFNRDNLFAETEAWLTKTLGPRSVRQTAAITSFSRNEIETAHKRLRLRQRVGEPGQPATEADVYKIRDRDLPFWLGEVTEIEHDRRKRRTSAKSLLRTAATLRDNAPKLLSAVLLIVLKQLDPTVAKRLVRHAAEAHGFAARDIARTPRARRTVPTRATAADKDKPREAAIATQHHGSRTSAPLSYLEIGLQYDVAKERLRKHFGHGAQADLRRATRINDRRISETLSGRRVAERKLIDAIAARVGDDVRVTEA